jgi:membrane protein DedA with SNARE-associated domain
VNLGPYLGITAFLILTGCGLPIPEEVPIVMAGVLSAQGTLLPGLAFCACLIGALVGDCAMYAIGYHFGHNLLKDHPKLAHLIRADREARFEQMIDRHGLKVLFVARFMVGVRSPVYLSAGILRVSFRRFLAMDLLCATTVVAVFFCLAYFFGAQVTAVFRQLEIGLTLSLLLGLGAVAGFFYWRHRRRAARHATVPLRPVDGGHGAVGQANEGPYAPIERRRRA